MIEKIGDLVQGRRRKRGLTQLVLPAAVMAGDSYRATNTMIPNLTAASTKAQAHVTDNNRGVLQPLITDLNTQIATAISANNGLAATVLAFTPAQ